MGTRICHANADTNGENKFEPGIVRASECLSYRLVRRQNRDILSLFFNMKVYCVFSLDSPDRADSNEYNFQYK